MSISSPAPFGVTPDGRKVELLTLDNGVISCKVLTLGAMLQSLFVPGKNGAPLDVVLGCDSVAGCLTVGDGYLGAIVGRYANRIAKGRFSLNGREYSLARNNGANHLHGGPTGFSTRIWTVEELTGDRAVLSLDSPDGDEGYPGDLHVKATYALEGASLRLHYEAVSGADTVCNLTNHAFFNLSGHASGHVLDQQVQIFADRYTPTDEGSIPLGSLAPVEGTPLDLRQLTPIGAHVDDPFPQLVMAKGYDHNFVLNGPQEGLRPAALAWSPKSGVTMAVDTTLPGLQFYSANYLVPGSVGKGGAVYGPRHAFCLETQFFPDSPNQPAFPSAVLRAGEAFDHTTVLRFGLK